MNQFDNLFGIFKHKRQIARSVAAAAFEWETIIIHLTKKKLEFIEQRDWQSIVKGKTPSDMPQLEEFIKFLTERCHMFRVLNNSKEKPTAQRHQQQKKDRKKRFLLLRCHRVIRFKKNCRASSCKKCQDKHNIMLHKENKKNRNVSGDNLFKEFVDGNHANDRGFER